MQHHQRELLKLFYQTLKDQALPPDHPYYEAYLEKDLAHDPIARLCNRIEWSEAASVSLLSGQRGSGKSTGLLRLKKMLEEQNCTVFLCNMRDYLNLTEPVEVSDFLIAAMGALTESVQQDYGKDFTVEGYWQRITSFLQQEVQIEGSDINAGIGTIKASLKEDPSFKRQLQQHLRGHVAKVIMEAHKFAREIVTFIRQHHHHDDKKVVLILDSVEQLRGVGEGAKAVYDSVENLLSAHAEKLHLDMLHVVYTIPPYLTPLAPNVGAQYGGFVYNMPCIPVLTRDTNADNGVLEDAKGLDIFEKIISKRRDDWQQVFTSEQLHHMCLSTGGDLRELFRLIREVLSLASITESSFPVSSKLIAEVESQFRREMLPIPENDKRWLQNIAATKNVRLEQVEDLDQLARFFDNKLVLNYVNGDDWYDVHPLIRDAIKQ